jgi:4-carboxymuconolactone decarboxylase
MNHILRALAAPRAAACIAAAAFLLAGAAPARADDGGPRFPKPAMTDLNDAQKAVAAEVLKQSSSGLGGPYGMLLKSPELLRRYLMMTDYLRQKTSLPKRLNEMAILIEARLWDAQYEWWAHYPLALKAGLSEAVIRDIRDGRRPAAMAADEEVVYDVVIETIRDRRLTDQTFQKAKTVLGEQQVVDLVATAGFYMMVSAVVIAGQVAIPEGDQHPLPVLLKH